ncbi:MULTISPECIES: glycohydrolase toxin TNT-related protein [Amycolatopsis]|uniref:glycohydrolase toxin TNT-related protein n=1 Tax=Amycolatopsis TaxID=1813 RepID=UPI001F3B0D58|nr:glycohydrolase toxin TNT-related protein [Amycolatopsis tucumanensis]MCF6427437.1 glycohydrolase toxin TNT-related protein [Amycolatopsis tucumanensis]
MAQPTTQLNATEQDTLVKQIGLALLRAAPRDWRRVTATYRAVGRYHELSGEVLLEDGSAQEWMATHDIATLFGRLRAGMYREGRGTWFNARYQLDHPSSYNLEYDRDEPRWDLMPPPQAYADELRMFPRSEDNVPEWLMRRMAGLAPEQPGPRFRIARIFDGHEPNGRPVLNRPELDADEQQRVLEYLNNAPVVRAERGFDLDRLAQQPAATVPVAFHTDGVWIWPAAVNYYLQEYGVAPEAELVAHIAAAGHTLPEVPEQTVQAAGAYLNRGPAQPPRRVPEQAAPPPAEPAPAVEAEPVEQPTTLTPVIDPDAGPPTMLVQPAVKDAEPEPAEETGDETRSWDAREAFTDSPRGAEGAARGAEGAAEDRPWEPTWEPRDGSAADEEPTEGRGWDGREAYAAQESAEARGAAGAEGRGAGPEGAEARGFGAEGAEARGFGPEGRGFAGPEGRGFAGPEGPEARGFAGPEGPEARGFAGPEGPEARGFAGPEGPEARGFAGPEGPEGHGLTPEARGPERFGQEAPEGRGLPQERPGPEARGQERFGQAGSEGIPGQEGLAGPGFGQDGPEGRGSGPEPRAFGQEGRGAGPEPRGFGQEAPEGRGQHGLAGPESRGFGQEGHGTGPESRGFGQEAPEGRGQHGFAGQEGPESRAFGQEAPEGRGQHGFARQEGPESRGYGQVAPEGRGQHGFAGAERFGQEAPEGRGPRGTERFGPEGQAPGQVPAAGLDARRSEGFGQEAPEGRGQRGFAGPEGPEGREGRAFVGHEGPDQRAFTGHEGPDQRGFTSPESPDQRGFAGHEGPDQGGFTGQESPDQRAFTSHEGPDQRAFTGHDDQQDTPPGADGRSVEGRPGFERGGDPRGGSRAFAGQAPRGGRPSSDGPPTMLARPVSPPPGPAEPKPSGPVEPALDNLRSKLADLGVPDGAYRIGEPAEHGWSLEKVDDGWRVGWYDEALTSPAVFGDADDAAAFMLGKLLLNPGGRTTPPARPEMDATEVPLTPAQEPAEPQRHDLPQRTLTDRLDEPDPAGPPTVLAAPPVAPPPPAPPRREPPPRRVEPAAPAPAAATASAASGGGNQQWPIQPLPGEPPLTLFRGKEMRELPAGSELDRFGGPNGNLTYAAGTPFEERSLVPEWVTRPYHVYRVQRPIEALAGVAIPWFNQPGGGAAYLLPASIEDLLASGDLIELDPGEPPID